MSLIAGIADEKTRAAASGGALQAWAASAPVDAAAWVDANMPGADGKLLWCVAERYGRASPRANADWLLKRMPPEKRDEAYGMCLYQWAESAPDGASSFVSRLVSTPAPGSSSRAKERSEPARGQPVTCMSRSS